MKNRKAQYYLIAAVIIIIFIVGVSIMMNYIITKKKPAKFYDLGKELKEECSRVIDYGIYNELNVSALIEDFINGPVTEYLEQEGIDVEFAFIYGEKENIKIATYGNQTLHIGRIGYDTVFEDVDADWTCIDRMWNGNIDLNNQKVLLRNCTVNGKASVKNGGGLKIISSTIAGNNMVWVSGGTDLEIINSYVTGKIDASGDSDKIIINTTVNSEVHVADGTLFFTDNVVYGSLNTKKNENCPEVIQIGDNIVYGGIQLCRGVTTIIEVEILNETYDFGSREGNNCFFVLAQRDEGEVYVVKSGYSILDVDKLEH